VDKSRVLPSYPQSAAKLGNRSALRRRLLGVRIELTVAAGDRSEDVAVEAPETADVPSVLSALREAVGADADAQAWCDGELIDGDPTLTTSILRRGALVRFGPRPRAVRGSAVLTLLVIGGPTAGLVRPLERGRLTIGRAPDNDLVLDDSDISRHHATLDVGATTITLADLDSTNGTTVNGEPVPVGSCPVRPGDLVRLGDSAVTIASPVELPAALQPNGDGLTSLLRAPRSRHHLDDREIVLPTRSTPTRPRGVQWIAVFAPAAAGAAIAWFAHAPQFLLFALLSPLMMASTAIGDRLHWRRSRRAAAASYRRRRSAADDEISVGLAGEEVARRSAAPDPATVLRQVVLPGSRVWERRRGDADALRVRLGLADVCSALRVRDGSASRPAGTVRAVPLCVDLRDGPLGVAGPRQVAAGVARWLVGQLAALQAPADVEIALLIDAQRADEWRWARWLPHVRGRVADGPEHWSSLVAELSAQMDERCRGPHGAAERWLGRWLVLVIDRAGQLADVRGLAELLTRGPAAGLTAVCIDDDVTALPAACVGVAQVRGVAGSRLAVRLAGGAELGAVADQVPRPWAAELAHGLAPLVDPEEPDAVVIPAQCRLPAVLALDDWSPDGISTRWTRSDGAARTALGRTAGGVVELDLVRDGPHALIAGTTGSGKSELLQTLVAGLAANHPPDELNVLLIDYKGGAAFADCARLPHTAGLVTDLDAFLTERALRALHSELRRREGLFAAVGATDLIGYRARRPDEPLPRLVIVVDEFATLAHELPDFLRGLIGVAQRGRSLGVHLILATQRPGSVVSADIRTNTDLRIALRVTDPAESTDVIGAPLAAMIDRSYPGRAYLRSGTGLTCFQTAHAGAATVADVAAIRVERLGPWLRRPATTEMPHGVETDLTRLVETICRAAERSGREAARRPWSAPLPDLLPLGALDQGQSTIAVGMVDLPDQQRTDVLSFDIDAGATLLLVGGKQSGRTSALAALASAAAQRTPRQLHLYCIDAAGALSSIVRGLPHCATAISPPDPALTMQLLRRLEHEAATRTVGAPDGDRPRILLLIDGWETVCAALPDLDAALCSDALTGLLRASAAARINVAVAGDRSLLTPRFAGAFGERVLLRLADRNDFTLAGIRERDVPVNLPPGRGVRTSDGAVVQLAHAGDAPDLDAARQSIDSITARWRSTGDEPDDTAIRLRPLPEHVQLTELPASDGRLTLGLAGDRSDLLAVDPFAGAARILVAGPPRSGRSTVLRLLARQAHSAGIATLVAATSRSPLNDEAQRLAIPVFGPDDVLGDPPAAGTLLLIDDCETFTDTVAGERLASWSKMHDAALAVVAAARADDLATSFRGIAVDVRRNRCGILLRPGPLDGELLGVRLPRNSGTSMPGRGVAVGDASWGAMFERGEAVPIQVAVP
jgi:S-DNA-T family DNA segregation ATPase FtsK/SpoIIIE